jgi:hypothetical protein
MTNTAMCKGRQWAASREDDKIAMREIGPRLTY